MADTKPEPEEKSKSELSPLQQRIKDMEAKYKELNTTLQESKAKVIADESDLLTCLQELMPLQNAYLGGIIQAQQKQLSELSIDEAPAKPVATPRVRTRQNNVVD
jgi:hypothetical protein